ncbi:MULTISPECIES: SUMF1/EgtB/PvdO family nonheme iron enzyme [unclassified Roseofilum]|uniref:SUMF1/EgtB/PvdO family nonheme iron enzyme n=1 Tax=unclassified Roseofilum TaxID=2620099 RepID=UPI001B257801|nr:MULTISPECIES: SUMF1/EgtB/PvdO family nonheme iron enzyme [unclassified Roseofilum]MBP0009514.1 SUMF1/EgtB/PvdO family nonheme iron enzyme [Roseofilum sp. Belize Diploria]MBP0033996.1 SUMF1/EgtB/PvdO family nonheme iron enzyme [Roseofilum sp. Belize BBD 4]
MKSLPGKQGLLQKFGNWAKSVVFPTKAIIDNRTENTEIMAANQREIAEQQQKIQLEGLKLQYVLQEQRREHEAEQAALSRDFQRKQAELSREHQEALTRYIQDSENRRLASRIEHERWLEAQRQQLQRELQKSQQEFSLFMAFLTAKINRDTDEERRILDNQPWRTPPKPLMQYYEQYRDRLPIPPLVVVSPPDVEFDRYPNAGSGLPRMANDIEGELSRFLESHYPERDSERPAKPIAGLWDTNRMKDGAAVLSLHYLFAAVPTIILESKVAGDLLNFSLFSWDAGQLDWQKESILFQFSHKEFMYDVQRELAREWEEKKQKLIEGGLEVKRAIGGSKENESNEFNLMQLLEEEKYAALDVEVALEYRPTPSGIMRLKKYLSQLHCLAAGMALDDYHLLRHGAAPKMPELLAEFIEGMPDYEVQPLLEIVLTHYQALIEASGEVGFDVPSLLLDVALAFSNLPDSSPTQQLMEVSINRWLSQRQLPASGEPLETLASALNIADEGYVAKLNRCLSVVGDSRQLDIAQSCYRRGVKRLEAQDYEGARYDFEQTITLAPRAIAYYQRGLAYRGLGELQKAITDLDKAVNLQPNQAKFHEARGDVYRQLNNIEMALANYGEAKEQGAETAARKLEELQLWWTDERRKAKEAEEARKRAKAEQRRREEERRKALNIPIPVTSTSLSNLTLELVYVEGGTFQMGGTKHDNEKPIHAVTVPEFRMGKYPITQAQYEAVMGTNPSHFKVEGANRPVECVSWDDAQEFCKKLSELIKQPVRLPSEAEWEYAARGGNRSQDYEYAGSNNLDEVGWYEGNSGNKTHPVGGKKANELGICDMSGNVWEWCADEWHGNYTNAPNDGSIWSNSDEGNSNKNRLLRGGSWLNHSAYCRSRYRVSAAADSRRRLYGFRVVCPLAMTT